ncbi:hypothetical protein ISU02_02650 [Fusibacter sp. Q10-2]|uniref:SH3 domain-containing protein n=2 Tax=Fusibacter ferrireducens TaxID=2785058 RepID=A0ABR9ZNG0_9FIRM|nr:hypothetical protein [Fusibacter ferrireducens]
MIILLSSCSNDEEIAKLQKQLSESEMKYNVLQEQITQSQTDAVVSTLTVFDCSISPDSKLASILLMDSQTGDRTAFLYDLDQKTEQTIANGALCETYWSPDSRYYILDSGTFVSRIGTLYATDSITPIKSFEYDNQLFWLDSDQIVYPKENEAITLDAIVDPQYTTDIVIQNVFTEETEVILRGTDQYLFSVKNIDDGKINCIKKYIGQDVKDKEDENIVYSMPSQDQAISSDPETAVLNSKASTSENKKVSSEHLIKLREGNFDIELFSDYHIEADEGILMLGKPAYGPICLLNRFAIHNSDQLRILNKENDYLTRISIEGVVPTWTLESPGEAGASSIEPSEMYIVKEATVFITPEHNSIAVNHFQVGKAVKVRDAYEDWFYIEANKPIDANRLDKGWVKKSNLGFYEDLKSNIGVEVLIKPEFEPEWAQNFPNGLWGEILSETEDSYFLGLYGTGEIEIEKENVEPFSKAD